MPPLHQSFTAIADKYGLGLLAYCGVAIVSALTEWLSFIVALSSLGPARAAVVGFLLATAVNFLLSHHFAFRSVRSYWKEFALIFGTSAIVFVGNFSLFYLLYAIADVNVLYAKILGTCFGFGANYAARQFLIFSRVSRFPLATAVLRGKFRRAQKPEKVRTSR
jgi:putative flippase GtrA